LATALAARQRGVERVVVIDGQRPPIDKPCGEGLMPDGVRQLEALGVTLPQGRFAPIAGIRYVDGPTTAEGSFPAEVGLGIRRTLLHAAMVEAAHKAEIELRWTTKATALLPATLDDPASNIDRQSPAGVETASEPITARWVVAADGLNSRLRGWAGLDERPSRVARRPRRFAVRRHFRIAPWSDKVEVHWSDGAEAYVTPVGAGEVGVALLVAGQSARFEPLLARFPALAARLQGAEVASRIQGRGPLERRARGVTRGRLALVGDAGGYVDAITGEGLSLAFHQAIALATAIHRDALAEYARAHGRIGRLPNGITRLMLAMERRPRLRRMVVRALAAEPQLFNRVLAVHCRHLPLARFGAANAARLAKWLLLTSGS